MTHNSEPKTELTDDDRGRWLVTTEHSVYLFDFGGRTVQRVGGTSRPPAAPADVLQPLRHVVDVTVGRPAIWWMRNTSGGYLDPTEIWQHGSVVISIQPAESEAEQ